jgi:gliding motility-associated-like protein
MKKILFISAIILGFFGLNKESLAQGTCTGTAITSFSVTSTTNISCYNGSDGAIQVTLVGGQSPFTYSLVLATGGGDIPIASVTNTTSQTATFSNLFANAPFGGTYKVSVVTSNGTSNPSPPAALVALCTTREVSGINLTQPTELLANLNSTTPACTPNTGAISISVGGGTPGYTFTWSGPTAIGNVEDPTNLAAGTYSVTVTDGNSCPNTISNIVVAGPPNITLTTGDADACFSAGATTANLQYSGTTDSPDQYSIAFGAPALAAGFSDVALTALPASPIVINVPGGAAAGTYAATLTVRNSSTTCTRDVAFTVTVNPLPTTSAITGDNTVCENHAGDVYSVTPTGGSTYVWTVPAGASITAGQGSNSITVTWGTTSGNVSVVETTSAGCVGTAVNLAVTVSAPPTTGAITGDNSVCENQAGDIYTVPATGGSTYAWTVPAGASITAGQGSNSITVTWGSTSGNVSVIETNAAGCVGAVVNLAVTVSALPSTSAISGDNTVCENHAGDVYSITPTGGSTYAWTVPAGASITAGQGTNSITVTWGTTSGNVSVIETNAAGCAGTAVNLAVTVSALPTTGAITGDNTVCENHAGDVYSVNPTGGSTYAWTVPAGASITAGQGTNSITITWGSTSGNVSVIETNAAGCVGAAVDLAVTVSALPVTGAITGDNTVCENHAGDVYSVSPTGGSTYAWSVPAGASITAGQGTNSITVTWGNTSGNVSVIETNAAGCAGTAVSRAVTVSALPTTGAITGDNTVCENHAGDIYSVNPTGGSTYAWTVPAGASITAGQGTNSITITWGNTSGNVSVIETNAAGCAGTAVNVAVTVTPLPTTGAITGDNTVCENDAGDVYSVNPTGGSTYAWTVPAGASITAGQGTNSITVTWGSTSGNVSVIETNAAGCAGAAVNLAVTVSALPTTGAITGDNTVCENHAGDIYSVTATGGSTYAWTVPAGASITVGQGTNSITVTWGSTSGNVSVIETNAAGCVGTAVNLAVTVSPPPTTGAITGDNTVCENQAGDVYSVTATGGSTYAWTVPAGASITAGQGTNSITITWGTTAGNVSVIETNSTGCVGAQVDLAVTVSPVPATSAITGSNIVCANSNGIAYSVTDHPGSTYTWTITGGTQASGGTTNSITVNWGATGAGNVQVVETNGSCTAPAVNLAITKNPVPITSIIVGSGTVCANSNGVAYLVTNNAGSTYAWTITGGTQASGTTTNSITVNWGAAGAGNIQVIETNAGCAGAPVNRAITINGLPGTSAITGTNSVCENTTGVAYSVTSNAGSTYAWTITGGTQASGTNTNSITVDWGAAGAGNVQVVETNGGCSGTPVSLAVTKNAIPATSAITGTNTICENATGVAYSVTNNAGSTYAWTITGGTQATGTSTNSITVDWGAAGAGDVQVVETNAGCSGPAVNLGVTVNPTPVTSAITGGASICANTTGESYSVTNNAGSTYAWTITGGAQASGTNTNTITVDWGAAGAGNVRVVETNAGCSGVLVDLAITINPLPVPIITGDNNVCINIPGNTYSTEPGMTNYAWTVNGGTITAGGSATDNTVTITWTTTTTPSVSVSYTDGNGCVPAAPTQFNVSVNNPTIPPDITGDAAVCINSTGNVYTTEPGMTDYIWTVSGGTVTAGGTLTDNSITVTWTSTTTPNVTVSYTDATGCTSPTPTQYDVTVNPLPVPSITGDNDVCLNSTGNVYTTEAGMTNYQWTVNGGTITAGGGNADNTVTITWTTTTTPSVSVTYVDANGCIPAAATDLNVTVNNLPVPSLAGNNDVCLNSSGNVYTTDAGMTNYVWSVTGGTITSGGGTTDNTVTITWTSTVAPLVEVNYADANGCSATTPSQFAVTVNTLPVPTISKIDASCTGATDGEITVTAVTGGLATFEYSNDNGGTFQASNIFPNLSTATYDIVIRDSKGCLSTPVGISINATVAIIPTIGKTDATCNGVTDGQILISGITGGASPYEYSRDNGLTYQTTNTFGTLAGGSNHSIIVRDANGCLSSAFSIIINNTQTVAHTATKTDASACIGNNGAIQISSATGGTSPYTYSNDNGATFQAGTTFGTLTPATYNTVVKDNIGCLSTPVAVTVGTISNIIPVISKVNATCNGISNGSITVSSVSGGNGPYEYSNDNGATFQTGNAFNALPAGDYSVVVRDAALCLSSVTSVLINNTQTVSMAVNKTDESCTGGDGTITISNPTGGTAPYTYSNGGAFQAGTTFSSLSVGVYNIVAKDAAGCLSASVSTSVSQASNCNGGPGPNPGTGTCATVVIVPKPSPAQCTLSNGRIVLSIKPFVPAVNNTGVRIDIQGISSTNTSITRTIYNDSTFNALPAGTYSYTIEYGDPSCTKSGQVTVDQSGTVGTPTVSNIVGPVCDGAATGSVTLDVPGETGNLLEWSYDGGVLDPFKSFTAGSTITGIPAGVAPSFERVISVRRNFSDPCFASVTFVIQAANPPITSTFNITPATCNGNDGAISVTATGGSGTYTYSKDGGATYQASNAFASLAGGAYTIMVKDAANCAQQSVATVTFPGFIASTITGSDANCTNDGNSGSIEVQIPAPGVYQVAVSTDQFNEPANADYRNYSNPSVTFTDLPRGQYYVYMKSNGSTCTTRSAAVDISGIYALSFDIQPICVGNELSLSLNNLTGEPNSQIDLNVYRKFTNVLVQTIIIPSIPPTGSYLLDYNAYTFLQNPDEYQLQLSQLTSANCTITSDLTDVTITGPIAAAVGNRKESYPDLATGLLEIHNFSGGLVAYDIRIEMDSASSLALPAYSTEWEEVVLNGDQQYEKTYENVPPGRYQVQVIDQNGCTLEFVARVPMDGDIFIPNIFTPNEDGFNDVFYIRNLPIESRKVNLVISNRWGKQVYANKNYQNNWKGEGATDGVYFYQLSINNATPITGWVEVLRGQKP